MPGAIFCFFIKNLVLVMTMPFYPEELLIEKKKMRGYRLQMGNYMVVFRVEDLVTRENIRSFHDPREAFSYYVQKNYELKFAPERLKQREKVYRLNLQVGFKEGNWFDDPEIDVLITAEDTEYMKELTAMYSNPDYTGNLDNIIYELAFFSIYIRKKDVDLEELRELLVLIENRMEVSSDREVFVNGMIDSAITILRWGEDEYTRAEKIKSVAKNFDLVFST